MKTTNILKFVSAIATVILTINAVYSQPVVRVFGSKNPTEIKKQAERYLQQLDVYENIDLTIRMTNDLPDSFDGITVSTPSQTPNGYEFFNVRLKKNLDKKKEMLVLAHEMIHVRQYVKKEIIVDKNKVVWKGKTFYYTTAINLQTPWEKEAHKEDDILAQQAKSNKREIAANYFKNNVDKPSLCQSSYVGRTKSNCL